MCVCVCLSVCMCMFFDIFSDEPNFYCVLAFSIFMVIQSKKFVHKI